MYFINSFSVLCPVIFMMAMVGIPARYMFVAPLRRAVWVFTSYKCITEDGYSEQGEKAEFYSLPIAMKLLKYVGAAREAGTIVPDFNVFDVREYGMMMKAFEK